MDRPFGRAVTSGLAGILIAGALNRAVLGAVVVFTTVPAVQAARPTEVPGHVAPAALRTVPNGPVVVTGTLRDENGELAAGTIALNVLPNSSENRKLRDGDALPVRTVGWATAGPDGHFDLRVNVKGIEHRNINAGGGISYEVVGWTSDRQGMTYVAGSLNGAPVQIDLVASQPLAPAPETTGSEPAPDLAAPSCVWIQQGTYDVWVAVGQTWPYGSDRGWMKTSTSHSFTVGAAVSTSGKYGDWRASGSTWTTSGITFTWAESTADREYREQHRYGKYRLACAGRYTNDWHVHELYGTGGYTTVSSTSPGFTTYPVTVSAGVWERSRSDGSHFRLGAGVKIAGVLGIDLSVDSNYSTTRTLYYRLSSTGKIFGDTNVPSLAARVRTGR